MLKACGGNPLAVIVTAGLLATKASGLSESSVFGNTVLSMMKKETALLEMTKILDMCYSDLPLPPEVMLSVLERFSRKLHNHEISSDTQMDS